MRNLLLVGMFAFLGLLSGCKDDNSSTDAGGDLTVSSISPTWGSIGTLVTINGSNFGSDRNAIIVVFGNAVGGVMPDSIIDGTRLIARIPNGVREGTNLRITVMKGAASLDIPVPFRVWNAIVATWKSEDSAQVGRAMDSLGIKKIVAVFDTSGNYSFLSTNKTGATTNAAGKFYKTGPNASWVYAITDTQRTPTAGVVFRGIYRVIKDSLSVEVVQISPVVTGYTPALPDSGFGSTKFNSIRQGSKWVQKFIRQP